MNKLTIVGYTGNARVEKADIVIISIPMNAVLLSFTSRRLVIIIGRQLDSRLAGELFALGIVGRFDVVLGDEGTVLPVLHDRRFIFTGLGIGLMITMTGTCRRCGVVTGCCVLVVTEGRVIRTATTTVVRHTCVCTKFSLSLTLTLQ